MGGVDRLVLPRRQDADRGEVDDPADVEDPRRLKDVDRALEVDADAGQRVGEKEDWVRDRREVYDVGRPVLVDDVKDPRLVLDRALLDGYLVDQVAEHEAALGG